MEIKNSISINEIFYSIQGEAKNTGKPTIFIRTAGCPYRCTYCDTEYAFTEGVKKDVDQILDEIKLYKTKYITITGGEPLAQKNISSLFEALNDKSYKVSIETSGLMSICNIPDYVEIIMDIKTPSSKEDSNNLYSNLNEIKETDVLKFVIGNREDYEWSKKIIQKNNLLDFKNIYFSPIHNSLELSNLANWILNDSLNVTLQLQLHKYIWGDIRGK